MSEKPRSSTCFVIAFTAPISFILGLVIGLVVLGWWLWPVEWTGGDLSALSPAAQQDYLSAAVSAYASDGDAATAQARFAALGEAGPAALAGLYAAQPERAAAVEQFAAAVNAGDALEAAPPGETQATAASPAEAEPTGEPAAPASGTAPLAGLLGGPFQWIAAGCIGLLVIVALILLLVSRRNRRKRSQALHPAQAAPAEAPPAAHAAPLDFASQSETQAPEVWTANAQPQAGESALPDWLEETTAEDPYQTLRLEESVLSETHPEQDTTEAETEQFPFDELPVSTDEELTDEDIAAITSQDYTPTGAAVFTEAIEEFHFPGAGEVDQAEPGMDFWMEPEAPGASVEDTQQTRRPAPMIADETPEETHTKFSVDIGTIEGIEAGEAERLRAAGVFAPVLLLKRGSTPEGRAELVQATGVDPERLLRWVNYLDLFRVRGVDQFNAELLEAAGVTTMAELAGSDPQMLHTRLLGLLEEYEIGGSLPSVETVSAWIAQARRLPVAVTL